MVMNRRAFLRTGVVRTAQTALAGAGLASCARHPGAPAAQDKAARFLHGVASGDPLADRVILWTRVSPLPDRLAESIRTDWWVATDASGEQVVRRGRADARPDRDFTIKVDAGGLEPGRSYYFGFGVGASRSPVGRTRTLPAANAEHVRLAVTSCANYPHGYFNAYAAIAARDDLDVVLSLGDYIYEYANREYGDGTALGRVPDPDREITTLEDYRRRHADYKSDPDLQAAHARHPWITVWDDHESADNARKDGAVNHNAGEGDWPSRKLAAIRAYYEWMPIRELPTQLFRSFAFGKLADLVMLDTRLHGRDEQSPRGDHDAARDPSRSLLGADQTQWLLDFLSASAVDGATWRIIGQQVVFSPFTDGDSYFNPDSWDGYRENRKQVLDHLANESIDNVVLLTGDVHSAWAMDVPPPVSSSRTYDPESGAGSQAVEFVTPAVSTRPIGRSSRARKSLSGVAARIAHLKYMNMDENGFVILDLTPERARGEFVFVDSTSTRSVGTHAGPALQTQSHENHLEEVVS